MRPARRRAQRRQGVRHQPGHARRAVPRRARHQGPGRDVRLSAGRAGRRQPVPADRAHARHAAHPDAAWSTSTSTRCARSPTRIRAATATPMRRRLAEKLRHVTDEFLAARQPRPAGLSRADPDRAGADRLRAGLSAARPANADPAYAAGFPPGCAAGSRYAAAAADVVGTRLPISTSSSQNSRASSRAASVA